MYYSRTGLRWQGSRYCSLAPAQNSGTWRNRCFGCCIRKPCIWRRLAWAAGYCRRKWISVYCRDQCSRWTLDRTAIRCRPSRFTGCTGAKRLCKANPWQIEPNILGCTAATRKSSLPPIQSLPNAPAGRYFTLYRMWQMCAALPRSSNSSWCASNDRRYLHILHALYLHLSPAGPVSAARAPICPLAEISSSMCRTPCKPAFSMIGPVKADSDKVPPDVGK